MVATGYRSAGGRESDMAAGRNIAAVLGGIAVAGGVVALVEAAGHALVAPAVAFAVAVGGYGLGALAGTALATAVAGRRVAIAVPVVLALLAAINLFVLPHPAWFVPAAAAALALGWWLGAGLGSARRGRGG